MGTRADFYVGKGPNAEWIGSVAWDGYEWGEMTEPDAVMSSETEEEFRGAVASMLADRNDGTTPDMGWPWPWEDSRTTDCAYCFVDGEFQSFSWGREWREDEDGADPGWPNMSQLKESAPAGSSRSGILLFTA